MTHGLTRAAQDSDHSASTGEENRETVVSTSRCSSKPRFLVLLGIGLLLVLCLVSICVGVADFHLGDLLSGGSGGESLHLFMISRLPRTLAAVLSGTGIAVAGAVMQMSVRNRFVSPTTAGTSQFALAGLLLVGLAAPGMSVMGKMIVASVCALAGSGIFLWLLHLLPSQRTSTDVTVPLIGLMLGGVVEAGSTFVAWRYDLLQSLGSWTAGDLSHILAGRYELLWVVAFLALLLYLAADRLTVASLGEDAATSLGLNYRGTVNLAIMTAAIMTAVSVVVVGVLPFLGLVVPNVVSRLAGDNLRRSLPVIAVGGAGLTLGCDIIGRLVRYPYEVPLAVVIGLIGSGIFIVLILRGVDRG